MTYEFTYSPFSGNGILARSLVKSFLGLGCTVTVWCCRPSRDDNKTNSENNDNHLAVPEISQDSSERLELLSNVVSRDAWRRVDDQSCWRDFTIDNLLLQDVSDQNFRRLQAAITNSNVVCVIDWSGAVAYRSVLDYQQKKLSHSHIADADIRSKFHLYLNFRVFSFGVDDPKRCAWFNAMEYRAMENASVVVSLSSQDSQQLSALLQEYSEKGTMQQKPRIPIKIVLPPLRQDMEKLSKSINASEDFLSYLPDAIRCRIESIGNKGGTAVPNHLLSKRPIITCVARQSPEKCIQRFVTFIEMAADVLQELNLMVVLAGAASDIDYARKARERLLGAVPSAIVIDRFLSSHELGAVFAHTLLNFHPSSYDAYGMTIVEAAAFGAPTAVAGPSVGAFRLLGEDGCLRVAMDDKDENIFSNSSLATIVSFLRECQNNETSWESLSSLGREKALGWDEKSYGERISQIIDNLKDTQ